MDNSAEPNRAARSVSATLRKFERFIVLVLIGMMMLAIAVATIELAVILLTEMIRPPRLLLNINSMLDIFGFFFMILIGLELLETIKIYLEDDKIHVEVVFLVAMIAVARKVIILEFKSLPAYLLFGLASVIVALSVGYYLIKLTHRLEPRSQELGEEKR